MIPDISEFNPNEVPYQMDVINEIANYDYSLGIHEVMLSGSVGSAKSLLVTHIAVIHCLEYPGANVLIGRRTMPSLRDTLFQMILDHISNDLDYKVNLSRGIVTFPNGSKIFCYSWHDKNYKKVRSYAISMAVIEELTENDDPDFYKEIKMRVGRLPNIPQSLILTCTNPDAPSHWAYDYFIRSKRKTTHVYYSRTEDNPFLPSTYITNLKETMTAKEARRMLMGEWIEISTDVVYYQYDSKRNFRDYPYKWSKLRYVDVFHDFNIGVGKPMSAAIGQIIGDEYHIAQDFIVEGARTEDILEEIEASGIFETCKHVRIFGDATGKNRDTRSNKSDYDIIVRYLENMETKVQVQLMVPPANPPVRKRHNLMNGLFLNANDRVRLYVYNQAKTVDKAFRLTKLRPGSSYVEDDSPRHPYQHVGTAAGYWCHYMETQGSRKSEQFQL